MLRGLACAAFVVIAFVQSPPLRATSVVVGEIWQGAGAVTAGTVRNEAGTQLRADMPVAPDPQKVLDAAIEIVKKNAWMRDNIDWAVTPEALRRVSGGATTSSDIYPAIRFLLSALKDGHSSLMLPTAAIAFRSGAFNPPMTVKALGDGIGYVNVPGYSGIEETAAKAFATRTHEQLSAPAVQSGCGWIVDLRANSGGNMWPMLAGLKPFFGDEPLGTFVGRESTSPPWKAGQRVGVDPPAELRDLEQAWVAVLTGPRTASSGEAVAVAFKGRPRTRSFGQPTRGLSSANRTFELPDGALLVLTWAIQADRTGKRYGEKVDPDEVNPPPASGYTTGSGPANPGDDATIEAAKAWLKRSCGR